MLEEILNLAEGTGILVTYLLDDKKHSSVVQGVFLSADDKGLCYLSNGIKICSPWTAIDSVCEMQGEDEPVLTIMARDEDFLWVLNQLSARAMSRKENGKSARRVEALSVLTKKGMAWRKRKSGEVVTGTEVVE